LIDILPDDVLLAIFDFCMDAWQPLIHVCRQWRSVVFGSPRRLNLRLVCTDRTPVRDTLDIWPPFPLVIQNNASLTKDVNNIVAVLERRDRVYRIELREVNCSPSEIVFPAMQKPFPELTHLLLTSHDEQLPVVPDSFLSGSALRLVYLELHGIPYPGLPKLLMTATHLVDLHLLEIPHSGYLSPDAMATALSTLTSIASLSLGFRSPQSCPDPETRHPPPPTRCILPVLTRFWFKGVCEYLDDLVAYIDAPRVSLFITFFNQIVFDTPQFIQFTCRTPTLKALEIGSVVFEDDNAKIKLSSQTPGYGSLEVRISCRESDWQVSSLEQVCTSCLPPLSALEDLSIYQHTRSNSHWQDNIDNTLWLELLHPFTAVKKLYLSKELAPRVVPALKELVEGRTTEVLPTLQNIFLEELQPSGPVQDGIWQFVAMRQASHPIAVSRWDRSGMGALKLPSTRRSARRIPAMACLFCRERKIACGAPPVGSADTTCKCVVSLWC
jgi:hypothetical protein